jgi:hypothetical protein
VIVSKESGTLDVGSAWVKRAREKRIRRGLNIMNRCDRVIGKVVE